MSFLYTHNKTHFITFVVLLCVGLLLPFAQVFAVEGPPPNVGLQIPDGLEGVIYSLCIGIGGFFLWLAGLLLDFAVRELVVEMGEYLRGGTGLAIDTLWVTIRDVFNVVFIFGIIYIGFRVILFSEDSTVKKTLGMLIVAALMINFSLFITKAIVDISNATASQIYSKTVSTEKVTEDGYASKKTDVGISYSFMNMFRMTTFATTENLDNYKASFLVGRLSFFALMMMFVMLIAAFVFASGAFLMVARFVGLVIFMIFSPAMFAGYIFPHKIFGEYMRAWWEKFLQYAFVAPAYLFMLYLSLFVLAKGINFETGGSFAAAFQSGSGWDDAFIIFLHFFIIAGFLIAALLVAQKMSIYGATGSVGMLKSAGDFMRGLPKRTGGYAAARTLGALSRKADEALENRGYSRLGMLRSVTGMGASAKYGGSYSAKDYHSAGKEAGRKEARHGRVTSATAAVGAGIGAAAGSDRRAAMERAIIDSDAETTIAMLKKYKPGSDEYNEIARLMNPKTYDKLMDMDDEKFSLKDKDALGAARAAAIGKERGVPEPSQIGPTQLSLNKAEMSELKTLGAKKVAEFAWQLTPAQIKKIKDGTEFVPTEKAQIIAAHEKQLIERFNTNPEFVLKGRKDSAIAELPETILTDNKMLPYYTTGMLDEFKKTLDQQARDTIRQHIKNFDDKTLFPKGTREYKLVKWLKSSRGEEF